MIVGKIYFETPTVPALGFGAIDYGRFIPADKAAEFQPHFFFSAPVLLRPVPIITCLPNPQGDAFWKVDLFDFSRWKKFERAGSEWDDLADDALVPQFAKRILNPEAWIAILLRRAADYFLEFTARDDWKELWERFQSSSSPTESDRLIRRRAKHAIRFLRRDLFICVRWPTWNKYSDQCGFREFAEDCKQHGIEVSADNIKQRARRLELPPMHFSRG